jgi:predicted GNAT superfamily acetyltransferase
MLADAGEARALPSKASVAIVAKPPRIMRFIPFPSNALQDPDGTQGSSCRASSLHDRRGPARKTERAAEHDTEMTDLGSARAAASAAARASGVAVREAVDRAELSNICELFGRIWDEDPNDPTMTPLILQVLAFAGNYVCIAEADGQLVGACVGIYGRTDDEWELHSHIAGVTAPLQGRNVGFALKTHQRAWALDRRIERISWTFDPLIRRNAAFNLCKLAVRPRRYLSDFYGAMTDGINAGDETDRLLVDWRLLDPHVVRACSGLPREADLDSLRRAGASVGLSADSRGAPVLGDLDGSTILVAIPADVERLRRTDKTVAKAWRHGVREVLGGLLGNGGVITGFARSGWYVVERGIR